MSSTTEKSDAARAASPARTPAKRRKRDALATMIDEASRLHFRLGALAERIHGQDITSGQRALLRNLIELGPKTVPELAAMRPVSRQYIQGLVNGLEDRELVRFDDNPAHKRSKLVSVTEKGRAHFAAMRHREKPVEGFLMKGFSVAELETAALVMTAFRERVDAWPEDRVETEETG